MGFLSCFFVRHRSRSVPLSKPPGSSNNMSFWSQKRVVVTGGRGFIGSHLAERLLKEGANDLEFYQVDLADPESCRRICRGADIVMHLAGKIRGVGYNVKHHGEMFFSNAIMNLHMMEAARLADVDRVPSKAGLSTTNQQSQNRPVPWTQSRASTVRTQASGQREAAGVSRKLDGGAGAQS